MNRHQTSSNSSPRLLDLPNDVLSRIIHFTVPAPTCCPAESAVSIESNNIGLTCTRLYNLVKRRLSVLDFVYPANTLTHMCRFPKMSYDTIEAFTKLASPFVEVLRLPPDFHPRNSDMSSFGRCPHLKELSIPITMGLNRRGAQNFLIPLTKLEVFTIHSPRTDVFRVLRMMSWKLRELTIISVAATKANLKVLDSLLYKMEVLKSLTITFNCSGSEPILHEYNSNEQHLALSYPETLTSFSELLLRSRSSMGALRKLSVATNDKCPASRQLTEDDDDIIRTVDEINNFRAIVDNARAYTQEHPPCINLMYLHFQMYRHGAPDFETFAKGLLQPSTEVEITFETLKVAYPPIAKKGVSPTPVVTDISFFFDDDHWLLKQNADFKPKSVSILRHESARMLALDTTRPFLAYVLQGCIESIRVEYLAKTVEELGEMFRLLHFVTCFAPAVQTLSLPASVVPMSQHIMLEDLTSIKCAKNVRVLWLDFTASQTYQPDPRGILVIGDPGIDYFSSNDEAFIAGLPGFLDKVRWAFPNLTHLYLERTQVILSMEAGVIDRAISFVEDFENATGADASSVKQELQEWVSRDERRVELEFTQLGLDLQELGISEGILG